MGLALLALGIVFCSQPAVSTTVRGSDSGSGSGSGLRWPTDGYSKLPTLWFGANTSGPNDAATLELIGRHSLSIVSWGQSIRPDASRDAERAEVVASAAARAFLDSANNTDTILAVCESEAGRRPSADVFS